jgi:hypothetical protein
MRFRIFEPPIRRGVGHRPRFAQFLKNPQKNAMHGGLVLAVLVFAPQLTLWASGMAFPRRETVGIKPR